jgi:murein L,D-transpeptidase YafK
MLMTVQSVTAQTGGKVLVETYDSKGNKVQKIRQKNGNVVTRTVIPMGPVLNRPFSADSIDKSRVVMQVYKKYGRVYVYHKGVFLTAYQCVFGKNPEGQKLFEGDQRTPEGWFTITKVRKHDKWNYFLDIDYPNLQSYKNHEAAKSKGLIPANARIGGLVGIHGVWNGGDQAIKGKFNWTDGCVSLTNETIAKLAEIVQPGTRVWIGWEK